MAKKRQKKEIENTITPMTEEEKQQLARTIGLVSGIFSKFMLKLGGCEVDFRINGEDISNIEKLSKLDITQRLKLAVKEERYEDAAQFKKLLENKLNNDGRK